MLKEVNWAANRSYKTGSENEPLQFYIDGLCNSNKLDLLLGYFSSAAINILAVGFANFLYNGGTLRLVINNILSQNDKDALLSASNNNLSIDLYDLGDIKKLKETLSEYGFHFFECLAWLIANKKIQLKIIRPKHGKGIAHYKNGIFYDGEDYVGFSASCNFTAFGLLENLERLESFLGWENSRSTKFTTEVKFDFEEIFFERDNNVEYLSVDEIDIAIQKEFGNKTIDELIIQEKDLAEKKNQVFDNIRVRRSLQTALNQIEKILVQPKFPYSSGPREYQKIAYENWTRNDFQGLFAMATGTGKTITALNCILEQYKIEGFYRFIVLVPTIALATQWESEMQNNFNFNGITVCSSQNNIWEDEVRNNFRSLKIGNPINFCIVITYASFRTKRFQNIFNYLSEQEMANLTLIADEAHTLGSKKLLKVLPEKIKKRIGLSATPERQFDDEGENEICRYFNSFGPLYTFNYHMKKAIEEGVLCKYYYYPVLVDLQNEELIEYRAYTNELMFYIDPKTGKYRDHPRAKYLLLERKNVIHKAKNKSSKLLEIIEEIGPTKFQNAFIYVPEGYDTNYAETDIDEFDDDDPIISKYTELLYDRYKFKLQTFTGETTNREEILKQFRRGDLDALLAMKCLDEGVDIPQTEFAIFCSSTGNPRQYIQRRGRVLRTYNGKNFARIYDMIVKPAIDVTDSNIKIKTSEKNILLSEVKRLVNFAVLAENKIECLKKLEELCYDFDIDIYDLANKELEKYNN